MPCVVAIDLVVSHEYIFKFLRERIEFLNANMH